MTIRPYIHTRMLMRMNQELTPRRSFRRSETTEQREYEQEVYEQQNVPLVEDELRECGSNGVLEDAHKKQGLMKRLKNQIKSSFPEAVQDVKIMGSMTALETKVKKDINDPILFPEINKIAEVRCGLDLCPEEIAFLRKRLVRTRNAFARYLGLNADDVHPDDVPTVSFGGSGGGFRAMIGCLAYCDEMKRCGLWDCLTYVAGVSGSCWSLGAYYTFGQTSMAEVIQHCKSRFHPYHPLSGDAVRTLLSTSGGARSTLGPVIQKQKSGLQTVAMDLYSVFITGWIFFQDDPSTHPGGQAKREVAGFQSSWHRYSNARKYTDTGAEPLPIMTAIRHERPWKDWHDQESPFKDANPTEGDQAEADNSWFQWFEMTPYEIGCDEIKAWVPTWAFGRPFREGRSTMQLPEQSLALLLGLCTSAPAGPLTAYIATISRNLPPGFLGNSIHSMARRVTKIWGKQGTEEFQNHHPLHAVNEHNFMFHYSTVQPGQTRPPGLENSPRIHLIDSGMDNNCPTYVLLHPKRHADVIINMDASSDVQNDTFPERVNQIGNRRGLRFTKRQKMQTAEDPKDPDRFNALYAQIYDGVPIERPEKVLDSYGRSVPNPPAEVYPRACTMIYMPLLPNERAVPDFDPSKAKFSGSYNLVWTPEQVETLVKVCRANFENGQAVIKQALYEAYQSKRAAREGRQS